jgi:hypothetical protein
MIPATEIPYRTARRSRDVTTALYYQRGQPSMVMADIVEAPTNGDDG